LNFYSASPRLDPSSYVIFGRLSIPRGSDGRIGLSVHSNYAMERSGQFIGSAVRHIIFIKRVPAMRSFHLVNNRRSVIAAALLFGVLGVACIAPAYAQLAVGGLQCESIDNPLGIDGPVRVTRRPDQRPSSETTWHPRLSWLVASEARGAYQTAYRILAASSREALARDEGDLWDTGKVVSDETLRIPYEGRALATAQQVFWKVRVWDAEDRPSEWSAPAVWTMGILDPRDWQGKWIVAPWSTESLLLRKEFAVKPGLRRALIFVCGLGQYELNLNGAKVGDDLLSPGWTDYNDTCLYDTFDITANLAAGGNAVGLTLGDGMYHTERRNRFSKFQGTFGPQRVIAQIRLEYEDGTVETVGADDTWRVHPGPVTYSDIFGGEDYDARLIPAGWDRPGFDDAGWTDAVLLVRPTGALLGINHAAQPLRAIENIRPAEIVKHSDTLSVIDFGQNASYMPRIRVSGPAGSSVRLTNAEVLDDRGMIDRATCGGNRGPAWWQYTKATDGEETWFPQFYYVGCRYLQLDRIPAAEGGALPKLESIEGVVVHSSAAPAGTFDSSNPLLGRIRTLVRWAQRSNMVSVLTDCPHREKLGWLEQYHLNGPAIRYEFDVNRIFAKGMRDMADSQTGDGLIPNIAPEFTEFNGTFRAAAEWGCAFIVVPWQQYRFTGDTKLMSDYYDDMKKYMRYLASRADGHILAEGLGDWYDLGPNKPGRAQLTPPPVTATAFYYYDACLMAEIATLLGNDADALEFTALAGEIRRAWRARFIDPATGRFATGSQCSNALALVMGLADGDERPAALAALVDDVRERGNAMTAGDVGFRYLLQALAENGRSDVIYDMINQDEKPGYGYQLKMGATSLTEAWDANHGASHNHFMLGHITEWFYKDLVGIDSDPTAPGFKNVVVRPHPVGDLTWAEGTYESVRGPIAVRWERDGGAFTLKVTIPANTTATVYVPAKEDAAVTEGGGPAAEAEGVTFVAREGDRMIYQIVSGSYAFGSSY
jgi:hypothetical protein